MKGKKILAASLIFLWGISWILLASEELHNLSIQNKPYHLNRVIIKPKANLNLKDLEQFNLRNGFKTRKRFEELGDIQTVIIPEGKSVEAVVNLYKSSGLVEFAEPDYLIHVDQVIPNDPIYLNGSQWNLNNTGQFGGKPDADIDAPEGWGIQNSASNIIVAVIDSGIRYTHEDLRSNMWKNPGEIPGNGIDDDNNGYIDDVYGINAVDGAANPADPFDDYGHGTHVAGIIGASANNGKGVAGVAWEVKIMALKFIDSQNNGYLSDAVECINYAIKKGAKIINASWGSTNYSATLQSAISSARNAGIIFVASAGNEGRNNDSIPTYPASYNLDNIISVAATDLNDELANYSNYGANSVDLGAPGTSIYSTFFINDSYYLYLSGTSMAAPHVSGICALTWSRFPIHNYRQIIRRVLEGVDKLPSLSGKCVTGGRANLYNTLANYQIVYTNYVWIPTNGMTQLPLADNGISTAIFLPFDFKFFGSVKRMLYIGANGLVGFSTNGMDKTSNTALANTNTPNDCIYVYWDDLNPASKGGVHYGIIGSPPDRRFVATWSGVPRKSANNVTLTFQVVLEERTHSIVCQYQQVQPSRLISGGGGSSATVGIENADGTIGAEFLVDGDPTTLTNSMAILFIPYISEGMGIGPSYDLTSSGPQGGPFSPSSQVYYITNSGNTFLNWRVESFANWISVFPSNGLLNGLETTNITISINSNAHALTVGSYIGELLFTNLTSGAGSIRRSVTLLVNGTNAVLDVSPLADFNSSGFLGGPFSPQNAVYTLKNTGDAPLEWRAEFNDEWLWITPVNGFLSPMQSVSLVVEITSNAFSLNSGIHREIIRIRNLTTGVGTSEIAVNLTIKEPTGILKILPVDSFEADGIKSQGISPSSFTFTFTNAGSGTLNWYVIEVPSWISVFPINGSLAPSETSLFTVMVNSNVANLPSGDYIDRIIIAVTNGSLDRIILPTTLHIYPEPAWLVSTIETNTICMETFESLIFGVTNFEINILNTGGSNLFWIGEVSEDWLNIFPDYGVLMPSESLKIAVQPDYALIQKLPCGIYTNQIRLANQSNPHNEIDITVVLVIRKRPVVNIVWIGDGQIKLSINGESNISYIIEKSSNLLKWNPVETNTTSDHGIFYFIDPLINSNGFYRARLMPE